MRELLSGPDRPTSPVFIGVVHVAPTVGSPRFAGSMEEVFERAARDARALVDGGVDALIVENFGDAPFFADAVPPETIASLALALDRVRAEAPGVPLGVNVLRNDARAALALCAATPASFLRVNVHAGAMVTDQGIVTGRAAETLRERARLAPEVVIAADVHVKHATPLGSETLEQAAQEAYGRAGADVLIVSGTATGRATARADLERVRGACPDAPLWIGSGLSEENAGELLALADGAIVGTALKDGARVERFVDPKRVERLRRAFDRSRRA